MTLTGLTGTTYVLDPVPIGSGGEGDIYRVQGGDARVAKLYKPGAITQELVDKLMVMIHYPPNASVLSQVAWPLDLVGTEPGTSCGFIMPELSINSELGEIYKYPATLHISMHQKINIAQNICVVISEVHKAGYVFGDFNPRNIGLDMNTGLVSFLDTDTYHVEDKEKGTVYRCNVCASGYAAPELLEKCSGYVAEVPAASKSAYAETPLPTFTKETDNFALAIHIFKLLMNGYTPYGGIIESASVSQSSPGVGDAAVRRNSYCFKPGFKHQSAAILPLEALPEEIADLFTRAFIEGRADPRRRPDAVEWHGALCRLEKSLVTCPRSPLHQYDSKNSNCPLCEADERYAAILIAPSAHVQTAPLKQAAYASTPAAAMPQTPQPMQPAYAQPSSDPGAANTKKSNKSIMIAVVTAAILIAIFIPITYFLTDGWGSQRPAPNPQHTQAHDNQFSAGGGQSHVDGSGQETTPPSPPPSPPTQPPVSPPTTPPTTPQTGSPAAPTPTPQPPPPSLELARALYNTVNNTGDWVRINVRLPGRGNYVFERDRGNVLWTMLTPEGAYRIMEPAFTHQQGVTGLRYEIPPTRFRFETDTEGTYGEDREHSFTWDFETNQTYSGGRSSGIGFTYDLYAALDRHRLINITVVWDGNMGTTIFFRDGNLLDDRGQMRWDIRSRAGGIQRTFPEFYIDDWYSSDFITIMELTSVGHQIYYFYPDGYGTFWNVLTDVNEYFSWSYSFSD